VNEVRSKELINGKKFIISTELNPVNLDWGIQQWFSDPKTTGAEELVVVQVEIFPSFGHDFHRHPNQEESIFVLKGEIEQWLETENKILKEGDSAFIPKGMVHASFNVSEEPVKVLAILGPCIGEEGYELVDVSDQAPWNDLRS
jgi:quercetin dioxygenase-like cupin family protein